MSDIEIKKYLKSKNWSLNAQDYFTNIFNTSPQIINEYYNFQNQTMTVTTKNNIFIFNWILNKI